MSSFKRLTIVALLAAFAIASIKCNLDEGLSEKSILPLEEELDDSEGFDYEVYDDSENDVLAKSEYTTSQGIPASFYQPIYVPPPPVVFYPELNYQEQGFLESPILYNQTQYGYNQLPVVYNQPPVYYNQPSLAYLPTTTVYNQPPVTYSQAPIAYNQAPIAYNQTLVAYNQQAYPPTQGTYNQPEFTYSQPSYPPPVLAPPVYQTPVLPKVQIYQQQQPIYSKPVEPAYAPVTNYTNYSVPQPVQVTPIVAPVVPLVQQLNYTPQSQVIIKQTYTPQVANYSAIRVVQGTPSFRYTAADLASLVPFANYRANHWSLFYYRSAPYRSCPKNVYLSTPTYKDIEAAFNFARQQLTLARDSSISYLDTSSPSAAARHQVFSFLSQQNARLDEEGLLVEFVSQFLADRACLTKWDKQRYLPQLTRFISVSNFPGTHSCNSPYRNQWQTNSQNCALRKYRTYDGFCNNLYHPYWGKSNVCHIRLLSPDYADGISAPRNSYNPRFPLPNPRVIANYIHNDIPLEGPYNLMKMQWGQLINHDISNTALSTYDGLVDCCKNPNIRGCWPIYVQGDRFYNSYNVSCLNFIRSGVCPTCQLGPRQQLNKNTAFLDASQVYGNTEEQANQLREFKRGLLRFSIGKNGDVLLPVATDKGHEQCSGVCFLAGDARVNQHPALTALHTMLLRSHNQHATHLALRHPDWSDEILFQEARRIVIAEYQMITYNEYLPIVFGPILSGYFKLTPQRGGYTYYDPKADPTTWNEYVTAACRFGHSQIQSTFGLYSRLLSYGQQALQEPTYRLKEWFMRPSFLTDGLYPQLINGLLGRQSYAVDPWLTGDVRNHLYQSKRESTGGDLGATNIWRGRDHGIPGYVHYLEYCFNLKVRNWKDLSIFIPYYTLNQLRKLYKVVENVDLFTGGISERHFPGADIGPTFACINGIQYYHLKFGDRYYFEHANQAGSFTPYQLEEIKRSTLARLICRTSPYNTYVPQYAFLQASQYNPIVNCSQIATFEYSNF